MINDIVIRKASENDIDLMVALSEVKRKFYEEFQPQLWRSTNDANNLQKEWFITLIDRKDYFMYVADNNQKILGFIIGQNIKSPSVYDPGGLTLMIDDFCVASPLLWNSVGKKLLETITLIGNENGAVQLLIVSGAHDEEKKLFLKNQNLNIASEWYVKTI